MQQRDDKPVIAKHKRNISLDLIKATGVFCMIIVHSIVWWLINDDKGAAAYPPDLVQTVFFLKIIGLIVFGLPMTAGAAFYYYYKKINSNCEGNNFAAAKKILVRCLSLFVLGFLLNLFAFGFDDMFAWDLLQFISVSFIVLFGLSLLRPIVLLAFTLTTVFVPLILIYLYGAVPTGSYVLSILFSDPTGDNYWAFFPWFFLVGAGYLSMAWYDKGYFHQTVFRRGAIFASVLVILLSIVRDELIIKENVQNLWGLGIFSPPVTRLLAIVAIFILLLILYDGLNIRSLKRYSVPNVFSKAILYIYCTHIIIGFHLVNLLKQHFEGLGIAMLTAVIMILIGYSVGYMVVWHHTRKG